MYRRALTLLELLLAIGLLLALAALVFPSVIKGLNEREFESTTELVRHHLLLARAHAQATGEPVEVTYRNNPPRVEARRFEPGIRALQQSEYREALRSARGDEFEPLMLDYEQPERQSLIPQDWAYQHLAPGVWISDRRPGGGTSFGLTAFDPVGSGRAENDRLFLFDDQAQSPAARDEPGRAIRLAVYVADGSALLGRPVWIQDNDRRLARLTVNPWTGLPAVERVMGNLLPGADEQPEESAEELADELAPPAEPERAQQPPAGEDPEENDESTQD